MFNFVVAYWGYCAFLIGNTNNIKEAFFLWKIAHIGIIFIPPFLLHNTYLICEKVNKGILRFTYLQAFFFSFIVGNQFLIGEPRSFSSFYYLTPGPLYYLFFAIWILLVLHSLYELFRKFNISRGLKRNQIKYLFVGLFLGFFGGITNFLPVFNINIYPFGNITIPFYCFVVTYAILKYRLLDISVVITRTGVFIVVYSLVLGIPFALAFGLRDVLISYFNEIWWIIPLISSTLLATIGPFIYLYIQKRAENRLLAEQHRYQSTLRQASSGMSRIKDLKRLINLITHIVSRTVRLDYCAIYLFDQSSDNFRLGAMRKNAEIKNAQERIDTDSCLVQKLVEIKDPIVYDEIIQQGQDYKNKKLVNIKEALEKINAAVAVPSFVEDRLLGILVLGKKRSGKLFSNDDLAVFSILANQAGLAIENAQFYEDMKNTHAQLIKAEKMATIGTMADGLSHQINNRLHALGFIAGDV